MLRYEFPFVTKRKHWTSYIEHVQEKCGHISWKQLYRHNGIVGNGYCYLNVDIFCFSSWRMSVHPLATANYVVFYLSTNCTWEVIVNFDRYISFTRVFDLGLFPQVYRSLFHRTVILGYIMSYPNNAACGSCALGSDQVPFIEIQTLHDLFLMHAVIRKLCASSWVCCSGLLFHTYLLTPKDACTGTPMCVVRAKLKWILIPSDHLLIFI